MIQNVQHLILDAVTTEYIPRTTVEDWVRKTARDSEMTILALLGYDLRLSEGQKPGISVIALIAESHIAIDTWPEKGFITLSFYSCKPFNIEQVVKSFQQEFNIQALTTYEVVKRFGIT